MTCVGVLSQTNTEEAMDDKRALCRDIGVEEVRIVEKDGSDRLKAGEEFDTSPVTPGLPRKISK